MTLTPEQQIELKKFPVELQTLVLQELAAGNSITEIGHGFPAPPAGAFLKLARPVSTCRRADQDGLSFFERRRSDYSGEFSDAQRFFFVLEPPLPPPHIVEREASVRESDFEHFARETIGADCETQSDDQLVAERSASFQLRIGPESGSDQSATDLQRPISIAETSEGLTCTFHFRDPRPPHQIQCALERLLGTLFQPSEARDPMCLTAKSRMVGADYWFQFCFLAAWADQHAYSLKMQVSWVGQAPEVGDYYRRSSLGWFEEWTREFEPGDPPRAGEGLRPRYHQLVAQTLKAENPFDSIASIQQAIVAGVRQGRSFRTSHKEGGTRFFFRNGRFVRADYGDDPAETAFATEAEFLKRLFQTLAVDATRNVPPNELVEFNTWKLILRRMDCD